MRDNIHTQYYSFDFTKNSLYAKVSISSWVVEEILEHNILSGSLSSNGYMYVDITDANLKPSIGAIYDSNNNSFSYNMPAKSLDEHKTELISVIQNAASTLIMNAYPLQEQLYLLYCFDEARDTLSERNTMLQYINSVRDNEELYISQINACISSNELDSLTFSWQ